MYRAPRQFSNFPYSRNNSELRKKDKGFFGGFLIRPACIGGGVIKKRATTPVSLSALRNIKLLSGGYIIWCEDAL